MAFETFELMAAIMMMMMMMMTMWHEQSTAWDLDGKLGFDQLEKWWEYTPEGVTKNEDKKLLWISAFGLITKLRQEGQIW